MSDNIIKTKIYIDTSVYNRPFDDQSQPRICLETLAFIAIMQMIYSEDIELSISSVLKFENSRNPFQLRKKSVEKCICYAKYDRKVDIAIKNRAEALELKGIKSLDALHLACAEASGCDYFLTCDDRIIKRYDGHIQVKNPADFIFLMTGEDNENKNSQRI